MIKSAIKPFPTRAKPHRACATALLAAALSSLAPAGDPVAVPEDLLDDEHYREEQAINAFTAPSIAKLFGELEVLQPLLYKDLKRDLPKSQPAGRPDLALEIGFLIADGFLAVNSGNLADIEELATHIARYADGLGVGKRIESHAQALLDSAEDKDVATLKQELAAAQRTVETELVKLRDADLAQLISLGGWIRALDVTSAVATERYTPERARLLMREDIADYYEYSIATLDPKISKRPRFVRMRKIITRLCDEMTADPDAEVGRERVAVIRKSSTELVRQALKRHR
jgi:hypothetical protein